MCVCKSCNVRIAFSFYFGNIGHYFAYRKRFLKWFDKIFHLPPLQICNFPSIKWVLLPTTLSIWIYEYLSDILISLLSKFRAHVCIKCWVFFVAFSTSSCHCYDNNIWLKMFEFSQNIVAKMRINNDNIEALISIYVKWKGTGKGTQ